MFQTKEPLVSRATMSAETFENSPAKNQMGGQQFMYQQYQPVQNYQQKNMGQMTQTSAPNASVATMGPDTFQHSPYTQSGYRMGQQNQQFNQQQQQQNPQQQEQNYLQQVRQELGSQAGQRMYTQQQPIQQMSQFQQPMRNQQFNASLATMDPTTYQNSPYTQQQPMQAFQQQQRPMMGGVPQQPMLQYNAPNASVATMGPDTFQHSPYTQGGYRMGQQNQQFNQQQQQQNPQQQEQNYLQQVRQEIGTQAGQRMYNQQPMQNFQQQQPQQQFMRQYNAPNASVATMGPDTFQHSPYTQGGYRMGQQNQQFNQQQQQQNPQQQEQNYLQQVRQEIGTQAGQRMYNQQPLQ